MIPPPVRAHGQKHETGTFSIVGMDPETREWGVAVASRILDCGYVVIWVKPEVGAVATQGQVNARLGPLALEFLEAGRTAGEALNDTLALDHGNWQGSEMMTAAEPFAVKKCKKGVDL